MHHHRISRYYGPNPTPSSGLTSVERATRVALASSLSWRDPTFWTNYPGRPAFVTEDHLHEPWAEELHAWLRQYDLDVPWLVVAVANCRLLRDDGYCESTVLMMPALLRWQAMLLDFNAASSDERRAIEERLPGQHLGRILMEFADDELVAAGGGLRLRTPHPDPSTESRAAYLKRAAHCYDARARILKSIGGDLAGKEASEVRRHVGWFVQHRLDGATVKEIEAFEGDRGVRVPEGVNQAIQTVIRRCGLPRRRQGRPRKM